MFPPPLVARLVGIDEYDKFKHLKPEGNVNASNLKAFLEGEFKDPGSESKAVDVEVSKPNSSKEDIVKMLNELRKKYDRSKAILFFFSGFIGRSPAGAMLCPSDVDPSNVDSGITDQEFIQHFDNIARVRGNNITFLLDAPTERFKWGDPRSFVVIAPRKAPDDRKAFTDAAIEVLHSELQHNSLDYLTSKSFAAKIRALMPADIEVDCYGQNADRLLFNPSGGRAHYAFIPGRTEANGSITLFAGSAHGIKEGVTCGIYANPVDTKQDILGFLNVTRVSDVTTAKLCPPSGWDLPPVFYAVETRCLHQIVNVFVDGNVTAPTEAPECKVVVTNDEAQANIILRGKEGKVALLWKGTGADPKLRIKTPSEDSKIAMSVPADDKQSLMRAIKRAARFTYYISSSQSSPPSLFEVEFKEVNDDTEEPEGENLLKDRVAEVAIEHGSSKRLCLVIRNNAKVDIWPFVFICDPIRFTIAPWYASKEPLAPNGSDNNGKLNIGCGNEADLVFQSDIPHDSLTYIKIIVTKQPADFSFLTQRGRDDEDKLREIDPATTAPPLGDDPADNLQSPVGWSNKMKRSTKKDEWESMEITIKQTYKSSPVLQTPWERRRLFWPRRQQ
ncbi:hypothetical protein F5887DRAFT_1005972 [Amanita rubescens]|nr:hypothetical protein F5887DRAFT_1005972 [Amanita rubescens]